MNASLSADCHLRSRPPSSDHSFTRPDCRRAAWYSKIGVPGVRKASCLRLGAGADNDSSPYPAVVRTPRRLPLPNLAAACAAGYSPRSHFITLDRGQLCSSCLPPASYSTICSLQDSASSSAPYMCLSPGRPPVLTARSFHSSRSHLAVLPVPPAGILLQILFTARSNVLFRVVYYSSPVHVLPR